MGNNNSTINITLDRPQPTIYYSGDIISGQVKFTVSEHTDTIHDIYLTITGDVGYTTMRTTRMQNGQTERIVDHHDIRFFGEKVVIGQVISSQQGQAGGRINDRTTFEPGQYMHPFSIRLPDTLPPTLHPIDYPFVRYELQLLIEKKWYCSNIHYRHPLRIYPRVNLLQISNSQCAVKFDSKRKDITIKGIMQHSGLVPGEQTILSLEIYNPNHLTIKRIDICLIQRYTIEQCRRRLELIRFSVPQLFNLNDEYIKTSCPIKIPMYISPSYNLKTADSRSNAHVDVHYDIKLEVKIKGLFSDFELQVPIIIGTDSAEHSSYVDTTNASTISMDFNAIDMIDSDDHDDDIALLSDVLMYSKGAGSD
ncbi:unnamed protein product [Rotaria sp. Silwood2]|nr:unnamed protein product [Rotaria sp. Silwood2]CAF2474001.1 unnamed protein product [Rotaria sp. Silwood2]CAF4056185.1 unnamed protein product [Rotaria sp. Silwood2]CAF4275896.1 unnamed protein product [Rotaria sp. Silwood2]